MSVIAKKTKKYFFLICFLKIVSCSKKEKIITKDNNKVNYIKIDKDFEKINFKKN